MGRIVPYIMEIKHVWNHQPEYHLRKIWIQLKWRNSSASNVSNAADSWHIGWSEFAAMMVSITSSRHEPPETWNAKEILTPKKNINMINHDDDYGMVYCWFYHIIEFLGIILPCGYSFGRFEPYFCPDVSTYVPYVSGGVFNILYPRRTSFFWGTSFAGSMESGHPSNISESKWMNIYPLVN